MFHTGDDFEVAGTLGASGAHVSFRQQCSESLQVSTELETSSRGAAEAVATTGFALEMPKANCSIKGGDMYNNNKVYSRRVQYNSS